MSDSMLIHRYWSGKETAFNVWTENALRSLHPEVEIHTWGPGDWSCNLTQVRDIDRVRHESNVSRYRALKELGGIWLDHDIIPLCNLFEATNSNWVSGIGSWREGCAMRFEPENPFIVKALMMIDKVPASNSRSVDVSGAALLNRIRDDVVIETRVIPIDSSGAWVLGVPPIAIHLWESSRQRVYKTTSDKG